MREHGASTISVAITSAAVLRDATGVCAPADSFRELAERLVDTGIPGTRRRRLRHPQRHGLLVDVDPVPVPRGQRSRVSWVCENPISSNATAAIPDARVVVPDAREIGQFGGGQPARHVLDERHPVGTEVEHGRRKHPRATSTSAPGTAGARKRSARMGASESTPTSSVVQWMSPSNPIHVASSRHALSPFEGVPVSFGSSPMTTSTAAPARKPVITAFEGTARSTPAGTRQAGGTGARWPA